MAGNVKLIDPNNANLNYIQNSKGEKEYQHNGIPPYEDMYILAELSAVRRGRTILTTRIDTDITKKDERSFNDDRYVSFMGQNQDPDNEAHFNQYTTNWYDGSTDVNKTYEGFGISKIDIEINSSYIPQISIEFVDIRGLAFFNRENSPYRILFDFPPPIFYLSFKGYYGKILTYQMHLVKYNTEFKAETGNYHIDANFIAITYAPLTDIPFRYILQAPLMDKDNPVTLSPDSTEPPQNTLDLILKLEQVYSEIPEKIKTDVENTKYENAQTKLALYNRSLELLFNFKNEKSLTDLGDPILFTYNISPNESNQRTVKEIKTFSEYNDYLRTFASPDLPVNISKQLYIGYFSDKSVEVELDENGNPITTYNTALNLRNAKYSEELNKYKKKLELKGKDIISGINAKDIKDAEPIWDNTEGELIEETQYIRHIGINITDYYVKLYRGKKELEDEKLITSSSLNTKINSMILKRLGMLPTIYNIFEILMNDVDKFFSVLKTTTTDAEEHHARYKNQIINDPSYKDVKEDTDVFAFPLVVRQEKICNQIVEERRAPFEISDKCDQPFPELDLVQRFIDSFIKYNRIYNQATLKSEKDAQGDYKWIPSTPVDSRFVTSNLHSPYFGTDSSDGEQTINLVDDTRLNQIIKIFYERFQLLTGFALPYSFYNISDPNKVRLYDIDNAASEAYIKLYAEAEAINLVNSIINEDYAQLLKTFASKNNSQKGLYDPANGFFKYIEKNLPALYSDTPTNYSFSNGDAMYRDKKDEDFVGLTVVPTTNIEMRSGASKDGFNEFIEKTKTNWRDIIFKGRSDVIEDSFGFTAENVIFRSDTDSKNDAFNRTKFIASTWTWYRNDRLFGANNGGIVFNPPIGGTETFDTPFPEILDKLSDNGNQWFFEQGITYGRILDVKDTTGIEGVWLDELGLADTQMYPVIIDYDSTEFDLELSTLMYLSNFGRTLSAFNYFPYFLNKDFFSTPSLIELPQFVLAYMGMLVGHQKGDALWTRLYDFIVTGAGKRLDSACIMIFADIHDVNKYLSSIDKEYLRTYYETWVGLNYNDLKLNMKELYRLVDPQKCVDEFNPEQYSDTKTKFYETENKMVECKKEKYSKFLVKHNKDYNASKGFDYMWDGMLNRVALVCYSELTFRFEEEINPLYSSLEEKLSGTDNTFNVDTYGAQIKSKTEQFFYTFFGELNTRIEKRRKQLDNEKKEFEKSTGDQDIVTQTYYSFKNINDKWLAGLSKNINGYPFKTNTNKGLISQFAFVDRAMNPIGDTIIDVRNLIDAKDSPDLSIFTVISQMLSLNGFEFFPLQNFMSFQEDEWEDCFKIDTSGKQEQHPVFVCMFIGGTSSYPTGLEKYSPFKDDGIADLGNPPSDFLNEGCTPNEEGDRQIDEYDSFGNPVTPEKGNIYSQVRAFRVRYGEQNQNMFYNFGIDSKEYPETNESIQILSRLAGDEKTQSPVPKAQSLYSTYENRAYRANITGFGNAMLQPTQYFQLENVPIFNGAYIILTVRHQITANKMVTSFSGTKLLKYPMPRVLNPAAIVGFDGGSSDTASSLTFEEVTLGVGTAENPAQAKYNSMYTLEIY